MGVIVSQWRGSMFMTRIFTDHRILLCGVKQQASIYVNHLSARIGDFQPLQNTWLTYAKKANFVNIFVSVHAVVEGQDIKTTFTDKLIA